MNKISQNTENNIINQYLKKEKIKEIAKLLNINIITIYNVLQRNNIPLRNKKEKELSDDFKQEVINMYLLNNSIDKIRILYHVDFSVISNILKENNIKFKKFRKYSVNENYFEKIDSKDKAYFLGLLIADGYVNEGFQLSLQENDKNILNTFMIYIDFKGTLAFKPKLKLQYKNQYSLNIYSNKICTDLSKLGCIPNKSHHTYFPNIPEEFYSHFIRGVFDGDGCIDKKQNKQSYFSIIGNKTLIEKIQDVLILNCDLKKLKLYKDKRCKNNIMTLRYGGNRQISKIYNWLYKDCDDLYLERKKLKFEKCQNY